MPTSFSIDVPYEKLGLSVDPFRVPLIYDGRPMVVTLRPAGRYTRVTAPVGDDELIGSVIEYAEQRARRRVRAHVGE